MHLQVDVVEHQVGSEGHRQVLDQQLCHVMAPHVATTLVVHRHHVFGQALHLRKVWDLRDEDQDIDASLSIFRHAFSYQLARAAIKEVRIRGHPTKIPDDVWPGLVQRLSRISSYGDVGKGGNGEPAPTLPASFLKQPRQEQLYGRPTLQR